MRGAGHRREKREREGWLNGFWVLFGAKIKSGGSEGNTYRGPGGSNNAALKYQKKMSEGGKRASWGGIRGAKKSEKKKLWATPVTGTTDGESPGEEPVVKRGIDQKGMKSLTNAPQVQNSGNGGAERGKNGGYSGGSASVERTPGRDGAGGLSMLVANGGLEGEQEEEKV